MSVADRPALDVLHHEEKAAVGLAEVVDPHEVLVLQLGADPRLALEPRDRPRIVDPLRGQDLQRHPAVEPGVPGQVDAAHPPLADQLQEHIAVNLEPVGPPRQQLLRLPERQRVRLHRLPRQPAVDVLRGLPLPRRDRIPAGSQALDVHQAAEDGPPARIATPEGQAWRRPKLRHNN